MTGLYMCGMVLLMFILVINIALSLTSWILTIGHSSASTCVHHGREAPRQLRGYLQLIGIWYAGLWLTRRRRVKWASTVNCASTGRGIRLHFRAQIKLVSLNARHGGGRAGFCMTRGRVSVDIESTLWLGRKLSQMVACAGACTPRILPQ